MQNKLTKYANVFFVVTVFCLFLRLHYRNKLSKTSQPLKVYKDLDVDKDKNCEENFNFCRASTPNSVFEKKVKLKALDGQNSSNYIFTARSW